eukprot:gnl/Spiro4/25036_TR12449_c0_g1_i1.p1 gnl/Spiro4/25036_TR12449_c0_g1~~gnl/Spiro4/25036_TR12449_c0_g1_i1.p1  ORF type:complete len:215 (+),score=23.47 gnl/Spiro4/25036_TR12449_c0_g1_i1:55-645(+)
MAVAATGSTRTPSVQDILSLTGPTRGFLCPLSANVYNIEFTSFKIRDPVSGKIYFQVSRDDLTPEQLAEMAISQMTNPPTEEQSRSIRYEFPAEVLRLQEIGTTLIFSVGNQPVPNFRMIERHYFGTELLKSFDFNFGFCIPNSTNSWEAIYELPRLSPEREQAVLAAPYQTTSDSFYFVNDQLIMHYKAEYAYRL